MKKNYVHERLSAMRDWPERAKLAQYHASELAKLCHVNQKALERFFHDAYATSPQKWLERCRQMHVEQLLKSETPLKEIAFLAGYKQASHLTRHFKETH